MMRIAAALVCVLLIVLAPSSAALPDPPEPPGHDLDDPPEPGPLPDLGCFPPWHPDPCVPTICIRGVQIERCSPS